MTRIKRQLKPKPSARLLPPPDFTYERQLWNQGYQYVAGIDEVGRGALAGPVVVGVVCFDQHHQPITGIRDSKQLSAAQRDVLAKQIQAQALICSIGQATAEEIDTLGIVPATMTAIGRAVNDAFAKATQPIDHFCMDGKPFLPTHIPSIINWPTQPFTYIIKGDQKSYSIAAASIVAKVFRDNVMNQAATTFTSFGWENNKGYGTQFHTQAITEYGPCELHRSSFLKSANPQK